MDAIPKSHDEDRTGSLPAYEFTSKASGLITIRWNRAASDDESEELMERIAELWAQGRDYAVAIVTHPDVIIDARHRKLWGEWHETHREKIERYCRGMAITMDSAAIRALMTVMSWFSKDGYPINYVKSEREARAWAASRLLER
jgi:hypothetical protein